MIVQKMSILIFPFAGGDFMSDAQWKGHLVNAMRVSGFSTDMIKKVLRNLDKGLCILSNDEVEAIYAKTKLS